MDVNALVNKYWEQIKIEDADFIPVDDAKSDAAYLALAVPRQMLKEYSKLTKQKGFPNAADFWRKTKLLERLYDCDKDCGQCHVIFLTDVLDYLGGNVWAEYQKLNLSGLIGLSVIEIPEFFEA